MSASVDKWKLLPSGAWLFTSCCADVAIIPTFADNYSYIVIDRLTKEAASIDSAEPRKLLRVAEDLCVKLVCGFTTHKHSDHSGGNDLLLKLKGKDFPMIGPDDPGCPGINTPTKEGDRFNIGNTVVEVRHTPCHTRGHVIYNVTPTPPNIGIPMLFTGDILFLSGCGRFMEGDGRDMQSAMNIIKSLPGETHVFCGHEYSIKNLEFALSVESHNEATRDKLAWAKSQRTMKLPTIPSTVAEEKSYNPFMRTDQPDVIAHAKHCKGNDNTSEAEVMTVIRKLKDAF